MNSFKIVIFYSFLFSIFLLTVIGYFSGEFSRKSGHPFSVCQGGVEYLQFSSGVSVAYTPDGKIKTCSN